MLLSITLLNKDCSSKNIQKDISVEYTESTRGSYFQVILKKETISINKKRGSNPVIKVCPENVWEDINYKLNKIDIQNLENFRAPSKNNQFDGSKIAFLKIIKNKKTYQSQSFDHDNPPNEIVTLVKEILSVVKNIE